MKKILFIMPLMAISLLASCGSSKPEPTPETTYTITFKNDGDEDKKIENIKAGSIITENIPTPITPKPDSTFIGWCTDNESKNLFDFDTVKIYQDYTLYSGWKRNEPSPIVYHTITFHSNGGSEVPVLKVEDGKLAVEPKDPTKDTFMFAGWYEEETLDNYLDFPKTPITRDYDLYARWEATYEYSVTLDCDNKLRLETDKGFLNQKDYTSEITLNSDQIGKYDIPEARGYYQVTVNGRAITDFTIEKVEVGVNTYHVNITIPKEQLGDNIVITTTPYTHYVSFTAVDAGVEIYYKVMSGTPTETPKLKFCTDINVATPDWQDWKIGEDNAIKLENVGDTIYIWNTVDVFYTNRAFYFNTIDNSSRFSADGNVMSLINFSNIYENCFLDMFMDCPTIVSSPKLPATTLANSCYYNMFHGCSALISAPELPATTLATECYRDMFRNCLSLISVPELPATTLANGCYETMFMNCQALTKAPELPSKKLKSACYTSMFNYCSNLKINNTGAGTKFFLCPSDTTPKNCVKDMFANTGGEFKGTPVADTSYYCE